MYFHTAFVRKLAAVLTWGRIVKWADVQGIANLGTLGMRAVCDEKVRRHLRSREAPTDSFAELSNLDEIYQYSIEYTARHIGLAD